MKNCSKVDVANFVLRIFLAVVFAYHAYAKFLMGWDQIGGLMQFTAVVETLGAIGLLVRCTARWAAIGLCLVMLGALYHHFFVWKQTWQQAELAFITLGAALTIAIAGAGKCGLGCKVCKDCQAEAVANPTTSM
jgi:uncharacterized membrane protein YphA (DoxX/SURF4 family)